MKNLKKNNKGFSLVELIVVVLIIAIIAVALAPQVIKWVNSARENTEKNQLATIKSAVDTVVSDCLADGTSIPATFNVTNGVTTLTSASSAAGTRDFKTLVEVALSDLKDGKTYKVDINSTTYTVTVSKVN